MCKEGFGSERDLICLWYRMNIEDEVGSNQMCVWMVKQGLDDERFCKLFVFIGIFGCKDLVYISINLSEKMIFIINILYY